MSDDGFVLETDDFDQTPAPTKDSSDTGARNSAAPETKKNARAKSSSSPEEEPEFSFLANEKEAEPCQNYRVDTAATIFGTCKCGHAKAAHKVQKANKAAEMLSKLKAKNSTVDHDDEGDYEIGTGDGPCSKFRLDTTATVFGMCKCGHKRADHVAHETNKAKQALEKLKSSNLDKYKGTMLSAEGPCDNYRVDTAATEFGTCLCGYKRDDHVVKEENAASKMLKNLKEKNKIKNEMADKEAQGLIESPVPQETVPEVVQLNTQEQTANREEKVKVDKHGSCCVVC